MKFDDLRKRICVKAAGLLVPRLEPSSACFHADLRLLFFHTVPLHPVECSFSFPTSVAPTEFVLNRVKLPSYFRNSVCLLKVSGLFATSHTASDLYSAYLTELRSVPRLSLPPDVLFRLCACSLIACCCHVQAFAVQGFIPSKQLSSFSRGCVPMPFTSQIQTHLRRHHIRVARL